MLLFDPKDYIAYAYLFMQLTRELHASKNYKHSLLRISVLSIVALGATVLIKKRQSMVADDSEH